MNINFQKAKEHAFSNVNKNLEIRENTTLAYRVLRLDAKVEIYANVVCEHCEIQIAPQAHIQINETASLELKNCVVKGADSEQGWRSKEKHGCLVKNSGTMKITECQVEDLTIDSTEQWAVRSIGSIEIENTDFCDCTGNFFRSGPKFKGEELKTENFIGQFFDSSNDPYGIWSWCAWANKDDPYAEDEDEEDEDEEDEEEDEVDCAAFAFCDFRFAPQRQYSMHTRDSWSSAPPFLKFDGGLLLNCKFTAQGDPNEWDAGCFSVNKSLVSGCTFEDCIKGFSKHTDFENCSFVNSTLCQV